MTHQRPNKTRKQPRRRFNIDVESLLSLPNKLGVFWKDTEGRYLGCNDMAAEMIMLPSRQEVVGRTDFDLPIRAEEAQWVREGDHLVKTLRRPSQFHYIVTLPQKKLEFITIKMPLFDAEGKITGIFGIDNFIDRHSFQAILPLLAEANCLTNNMQIIRPPTHSPLTKRQRDCLYYLARGMTAKQIAHQLNLSQRTVEHHLNTIKHKLNCHSRSELVEAALSMNLLANYR